MSNVEKDAQVQDLGTQAPACADGARVELITSREVPLGGLRAMTVRRSLPLRQRSMIGAWCFVDHYGPDDVSETGGMDVAPHPHTGLQTVSWLFEGNLTHHDSDGNHAVVLPGEVNLMTAGAGICHSEVSTQDTTVLHGVQLWTVLPDEHRNGPRRFDNYAPPVTPLYDTPGGTLEQATGSTAEQIGEALVFLGEQFGHTSPVPTFTPLMGAEIRLQPGTVLTVHLNPDYEHGVMADTPGIDVEGVGLNRGDMAYTGIGETMIRVRNSGTETARMLLIGGEPFNEHIVMWWNFIGRSSEEIEAFRQEWEDHSERFGEVKGYISHSPQGLTRIPAPTFPNVRLNLRPKPSPVARTPEELEEISLTNPNRKRK